MTENGHVAQGRKVVRYLLDSGYEALIEPLSIYTLQAINKKANQTHPDPDEAEYRLPFPESAIENDTKPADLNPEYVRLCEEARRERSDFILHTEMMMAVHFEQSRDELIAELAPKRKALAEFVDLPEDDWEATLKHCLIVGPHEPLSIHNIVQGQSALTFDEVVDGIRFFRFDLPGSTVRNVARKAPSVPTGATEQS